MGLFELLLGKDNPATKWAGENRGYLTGLSTSLLSDGMNFAPAQQGAMMDRQVAQQKDADAKLAASTNATKTWLSQNYPDLAQAVDAGLPVSDAWQEAFKRQQPGYGQTAGNEYQQRFDAGQQYGLSDQDLNTFALTGALPGTNKQNVTYGVTPIYGTDSATGKTGMGVQGSDGSFKLVDTGGFQPLAPFDLNAQKAAGSAFGKNTGGAQFDLPAAKLTTDQTIAAIADVRANEKGLDEQFSMGGLQQLTPAWPGSEKAKFQVANQRLTNRAFLEAREVLRGGGQITDFESRKAEGAITNIEDAMARGDKALYLKALADFESAVKAGYAKLEAQAGTMSSYGGTPATAGGGNRTSTGVTYTVEP
jgi:hypothetical protein